MDKWDKNTNMVAAIIAIGGFVLWYLWEFVQGFVH